VKPLRGEVGRTGEERVENGQRVMAQRRRRPGWGGDGRERAGSDGAEEGEARVARRVSRTGRE
jgi:hypothetical protein